MKFTFTQALAALMLFAGCLSTAMAQNATLIADDHNGIVVRFDFSDPILNEVETEEGVALLPRVIGDTPLLRAGAPDVSKVDATLMIGAQAGTALEVIETEFVEFADVEVAPSKGNLYRNVDPATVPLPKGRSTARMHFTQKPRPPFSSLLFSAVCAAKASGPTRSSIMRSARCCAPTPLSRCESWRLRQPL